MPIQITIRDVDEKIFREFKAETIRKGMKLGAAINFAMEKFRADLHEKKAKFTMLKPVDWGPGTERVSEEVDAIMYGE